MNTYQLKTNFKDDTQLRAAFIALSVQIFDLDFEPWYQSGAWDNTYQPFTYFDGDLAVANVSVSHMTLIINGQTIKALQVGTVMTHPDYRRRGLAKSLFQEVFKVYPPDQYQYFLAADEDAVPLYQLMGFEHWAESSFEVNLEPSSEPSEKIQPNLEPSEHTQPNPQPPAIQAPKVIITAQELAALKQAQPISDAALQVVNDEAILKFYYVMGFSQMLYQVMSLTGEIMGNALLESDGPLLKVYALYQNLSEVELVIAARHWGFTQVKFMYTPSKTILEGLKHHTDNLLIATDPNSQWMVHQGYNHQQAPMPKWPIQARFPKVSQT